MTEPEGQGAAPKKSIHSAKSLAAAAVMHFLNDLHPTLLPTFLPSIVERLSLSLAEAGFLNTLFGILNLVVQPFAGFLSDKLNKPVLILWAPLFTASGAYLIPIAPSYGFAMLFACMTGFGTASFHPQGHGLAGLSGGREHLGINLAVFAAAGQFGAALSPLYGVGLIRVLGVSMLPCALIFVVAVILTARSMLPAQFVDEDRRAESAKSGGESTSLMLRRVMWACLPITLIAMVRDATSQSIRVFLPLLVTGRGGSIAAGGTMLFAFTVMGTISNLIGGKLADMFGKKTIICIMLVLSPVFIFPAIRAQGWLSLVLFSLGGACINATNPVTIAMAQERVPESRSMASSLVMGVSWGIANIVASPIGKVADHIGLELTLSFVALAPLAVAAAMIPGAIAEMKSRKNKR
jgi:FSR family fosmidomycin resistance protein-like MFS transporter